MSSVSLLALAIGSLTASDADLARAATRVPGAGYRGHSFSAMSTVLNAHLTRKAREVFQSCDTFSVSELRTLQRRLVDLAEPSLLALYPLDDGRSATHVDALEQRWEWIDALAGARDAVLDAVHRDGLCHGVVLSWVHHIGEGDRQSLLSARGTRLPLLPTKRHEMPSMEEQAASPQAAASAPAVAAVYSAYESAVSCQQCHTGNVTAKWRNASLPPPLPVDTTHPGRERLRSCDFQNVPPCGPCDGLGGPRTGDGSADFTPVNCTVVKAPDEVPPAARVPGRYPAVGSVHVDGGTRQPLAVQRPTKPGRYPSMDATLSLGWDANGTARQRYDFKHLVAGINMAQIYLQSPAQRRAGSPGAMVTLIPGLPAWLGGCFCQTAIAGNMHVESFVAHEALDPLDLPPSEGGLAYLGRVRLDPIDDGHANRTVLADHWMKWAFHFLVDADPRSGTYGLPVRLFGALGVRQIFSAWDLSDPRDRRPDVWKIPAGCHYRAAECKEFADAF